MSRLEHSAEQPHRTLDSRRLAETGRLALMVDRVALSDGTEHDYRWIRGTSAAFIVPIYDNGDTVLVRQWRYPWGQTSWEVPAGTLEEGEEPLAAARRELEEEAGLRAEQWAILGVLRPSALMQNQQHLYLARSLSEVARSPEAYEGDMVIRRLPFADALEEALTGGILHATAVAALARAARELGRF